MESEAPVHRNTSPILANDTSLTGRSAAMMAGEPAQPTRPFIPTENSSVTPNAAHNLAKNLEIDIHLFYEEAPQRKIESSTYAVDTAGRAVELIHEKLDFVSMGRGYGRLANLDLREHQISTLTAELRRHYPLAAVDRLTAANSWDDRAMEAFQRDNPAPREVQARQTAVAALKSLKQLKSQLGYYGGSVEYQQGKKDTLEYYL